MSALALYFAYGSNLDPEQMQARCPGHRVVGRAWLPDYRLCFPRRSYIRKCATAGIEPCLDKGVWGVWGALYELRRDDMEFLDRREGYWSCEADRQNSHEIGLIQVRRDSREGTAFTAYTYFAVPDDTNVLPSPDYMGHLIRGGLHHGLPEDYIAALNLIATERVA